MRRTHVASCFYNMDVFKARTSRGLDVDIEEIPKSERYEYFEECPLCLMTMTILTQKGDFAEYETDIYVQCSCGQYLKFILPVN